ncbi:MAG: hypothetical protein QM346_08905 [Chloroflexota bacterium]|nr:hypothetical protein [Chloroflexota bacterium]
MNDSTRGVWGATLHVDLVWTDIEDFCEVLERSYAGDPSWLMGEESQYEYCEEGVASGGEAVWQTGFPRLSRGGRGRTFADFLAGVLYIQVFRFRRDRLKIIVREALPEFYAPRLLSWLRRRWGEDGVIVNSPESAPNDQEPMPLLPNKATPGQWDAWFDWYYRQAWGPIPNRLEHMASLNGKTRRTVENMHANYMADKR